MNSQSLDHKTVTFPQHMVSCNTRVLLGLFSTEALNSNEDSTKVRFWLDIQTDQSNMKSSA